MCQVHLVFMARALAVFCQALHSLVYESDVLLINIESQQPQAPRSAATYTIQELQCLTHQVVVVFVVLTAKEVLGNKREKQDMRSFCIYKSY